VNRKSLRNIAIAALLAGLALWLYPRHKEAPPLPVEEPKVEIPAQKPEAKPEVKPEEPAPPAEAAEEPAEEGDDSLPPVATPDEIKALRQQAKAALSGFYSSQRAFHMEFNRYTTDLKAAGWTPSAGAMNYKLGFLAEAALPPQTETDGSLEDPRRKSTDDFDGEDYTNQERFQYSREAEGLTLQEFAHYCKRGCTADAETFEIMLILPLGDNRHVDVWLINEKKELVQARDGVTGREPEPPP
jgi:hypothetical protein